MKLKYLITLIFNFVSFVAFAGGSVGNGGDVIDCAGRLEILDSYEARILRGYVLDLGAPNLNIAQKIEYAVNRMYKADPARAMVVKSIANKFMQEASFKDGIVLKDIDDSNEAYLEDGCIVKQIAIQNKKIISSDPFYIVDNSLWTQLDMDNKVILIMHEAIFRAVEGGWDSSIVRLLNSHFFSTELDQLSKLDYYKRMKGTPLSATLYAGIGTDGRWYFQIPNQSNLDQGFLTADIWTLTGANNALKQTCEKYLDGQAITKSKLPQIGKILKEQFNNDLNKFGILGGYAAFDESGKFGKYIFDDGDFNKPVLDPGFVLTENTGYFYDFTVSVWCSSVTFPFIK